MGTALRDTRVAELNVSFSGGILSASCKIEGPQFFWRSQPVNLKVDLSALDGKISQLKQVLTEEETGIWAGLTHPLASPEPGLISNKFEACMERVVTKGSALYQELSELGLAKILNQIDTMLREGDRLSIQTDCAFFPWEILYPYPYDTTFTPKQKEENPLRRTQLWGYKFMTECILLPLPEEENGWTAPTDEHNRGAPFVSFNLNKDIEGEFSNRPFKPIDFQREFFVSCIDPRGNWQDNADQIQEFLNSDNDATIIYLFCHGSSGSPLAGTESEELELAKQRLITPNTLSLASRYRRGPIVILNSCTSAAVSPLSFSTFHKKFRKKRAMGIIGTTIKIPTTFAAAFGRELIKSYLANVPIGKSIYQLRRNLLDLNNPLGLFYSLQCPSYITAPRGPDPC